MKAFLLSSFLLIFTFTASSQLDYFISIDADGGQPFSVMIGRKIWSSDAQGHLIVAQLKDSTYRLRVNFPRNEYPEHSFDISIGRRDRGYDLKKTAANAWSLYDWQRLELIAVVTEQQPSAPLEQPVVKRTDPLASLLAGTVNDSAVLLTTTKPKPSSKDTQSIVRVDSLAKPVARNTEPTAASLNSSLTGALPIQLLVDKTTSLGRQLVYTILEGEIMQEAIVLFIPTDTLPQLTKPKDSLELVVPVPTAEAAPVIVFDTLTERPVLLKDSLLPKNAVLDSLPSETIKVLTSTSDTLIVIDTLSSRDALVVKDILIAEDTFMVKETFTVKDTLFVKDTFTVKDTIVKKSAPPPVVLLNSDCLNFATDADVDKLRVKLLDVSTQEARLALVRKAFKAKCHAAKQARALSETFPTEEEKFSFLELAYPFISDTGNFKQLIDLFTETEIANRFKKLVRL